jgi:hypothetical protein
VSGRVSRGQEQGGPGGRPRFRFYQTQFEDFDHTAQTAGFRDRSFSATQQIADAVASIFKSYTGGTHQAVAPETKMPESPGENRENRASNWPDPSLHSTNYARNL